MGNGIVDEDAAIAVVALEEDARKAADHAQRKAQESDRIKKDAEEQPNDEAVSLQGKLDTLKAISKLADEATAYAEQAEDAAEWAEVAAKQALGEACLMVKPSWFKSVAGRRSRKGRLKKLESKSLREFVEDAQGHAKTARAAAYMAARSKEDLEEAASAMDLSENVLQVNVFFEKHKKQIYGKLEESDAIAANALWNNDMIFIAESLPIINGIIHVGSSRDNLNKAVKWVRDHQIERSDPLIMISALVFRYVVDRGLEDNILSTKGEKRVIWKRIKTRVKKLL